MNNELNILGLVWAVKSLPVKLVLGILVGFSVASWVIIFRKKRVLDRAEREAEKFEERFWSGAELSQAVFRRHRARPRRRRAGSDLRSRLPRVQPHAPAPRRRQRACSSKARSARCARPRRARSIGLEHNLEFLANVGSISPYVGLFGTVWGIMISFQGLANVRKRPSRRSRRASPKR